ncbi:thiamine diphosphokinase [Melghirimyces algeriensis]|uniref:Thiamine diphosphokinase n=1 Tax=Melghirimyces algeriensis TaxID=910412 RepID=A0A521BHL6_9BACL|nr:thiamine diphosphokinase [Melghirimyces algeriensis]
MPFSPSAPGQKRALSEVGKMNRWVIVAGGDLSADELKEIRPEDRVVGVDGGIVSLRKNHVPFHWAVGDFDTVRADLPDRLEENRIKVRRLPAEKDWTDTQYAVEQALAEKAEEILILGALGGSRFDHALANVFLLEKIESAGVKGVIRNAKNRLTLYCGGRSGEMEITSGMFRYVSLLPLSDCVEGIDLEGFRYPLNGATLLRKDPVGISNEIVASPAKIRASSGKLLVVESMD